MKAALRVLAAVVLGASSLFVSPSAFGAVGAVVDASDIELAAASGGGHAAKIPVANVSDETLDVAVSATTDSADDAGCSVDWAPRSVDPGRRTTVKATFTEGCDVSGGATITLSVSGGFTPSSYEIKAKPPAATLDWSLMRRGYLLSFGVAVGFALWLLGRVRKRAQKLEPTDRERLWLDERSLAVAMDLAGRHPWYDTAIAKRLLPSRRPASPDHYRVSWWTPLRGLDADWKVSDAWLTNITGVSTLLLVLLAGSDVLSAIAGAKPESLLGLLAVSGALGSLMAGLAPLFVKAAGWDTHIVTVGGVVGAGFLVIFGVLGQCATAVWAVRTLVSGWAGSSVILVGSMVGLIVTVYAARALDSALHSGGLRPQALKGSAEGRPDGGLPRPDELPTSLEAAWDRAGTDTEAAMTSQRRLSL